ncbi:MAG: SMP-30/gluconolactonase/LRE family protein [Bacteroidota bacterium]
MQFKYLHLILILSLGMNAYAQESRELAVGKPISVVDLRTKAGIALLKTEWRYKDAEIIEADFKAPGPKGKDKLKLYPTGKTIKTHNIQPGGAEVGKKDFDDRQWEVLDPSSLEARRGHGLLSFNWYRLNITIPEKIGNFNPKGSTAIFEIVLDDYSELWVDGKQQKYFGQGGNGVVNGFNSRNRVILGKNIQPGQRIQVAILGINGPLANIPDNYIWIRSATVDFYSEYPIKNPDWQNLGKVVKIDPDLEKVIDPTVNIEKVAGGFQFIEGPVWHPDGFLLFSDPNANVIYRYNPEDANVSIYISKSGYSGINIGEYHQAGSNGLTIDAEGRLLVCQHGNRQVIRHETKGPITVLASHYEGKKLNSPNDLVLRSDGTLYFTDPPYGLPKNYRDQNKEVAHQGVYALIKGKVTLLAKDLGGPNGIAFSPDEKYLYVSNWDIRDIHRTKVIWRYEVKANGTLKNGKEFFNLNLTDDEEALDGLKVDSQGNIFSSAPGGVWIISPEGKYLGKIITPERPANMAWAEDGKTLYLTAHSSLYRLRVKNMGAGFRKPN